MENLCTENLAYLHEHVEELRKLGKEMQMTEVQINECAKKAIDVKLVTEWKLYWYQLLHVLHLFVTTLKSEQNRLGKRRVRIVCAILVSIVITVALYTYIFEYNTNLGNMFMEIIAPYNHSMMRVIRWISLPFHGIFSIAVYHNKVCLVQNPYFFEKIPEHCWSCDKINVTKIAKRNNGTIPGAFLAKPVKFVKYHKYETTMINITNMIKDNYDILNDYSIVLTSTVPWLKTLIDLVNVDTLQETIMSSPNFHIQWISRRMVTSQIMRLLFPRPGFLSEKSEIRIQRQIIIDGPRAEPFVLTDDNSGTLLYMLNTGNRTLDFVAKRGCEHKCIPFQTVVEAGDLVLLPPMWDISVLKNGDEMSIASIAYVDIR